MPMSRQKYLILCSTYRPQFTQQVYYPEPHTAA
jgi:hypothetical protein